MDYCYLPDRTPTEISGRTLERLTTAFPAEILEQFLMKLTAKFRMEAYSGTPTVITVETCK